MMSMIFQRAPIDTSLIEHNVAQFVDDSNSVISFKDRSQISDYLNTYFHLLKVFYNMSKLQINDSKTNLMTVNNPRHEDQAKNIIVNTRTNIIRPKEKFKVLG